MFTLFKKILTVVALTALTCTGCGGGGSTGATAISTPATRLVGEIIANPDQLASSSLRVNATYSGDVATVPALHAWSSSFHALAKGVKPSVETWFVVQAFQFPQWDAVVFNQFIAEELRYAEQYDHLIFFGWQFVSELDPSVAGIFFLTDTRQLYRKFLK